MSEDLDEERWPKPTTLQSLLWRGAAQSEGRGRVVRTRTGPPARTGSAEKGVRMEMLQPSLEPAAWESCPVQSLLCSTAGRPSSVPFLRFGLHHSAHFTQLSGFVRKNPGGTVSDFHVLIFLGSKKYLCPQYLTHNGTQGTAPFIWANRTGRKRNSH